MLLASFFLPVSLSLFFSFKYTVTVYFFFFYYFIHRFFKQIVDNDREAFLKHQLSNTQGPCKYPCDPSLDLLQQVFLVLGTPCLNAVLQMGPHKDREEWNEIIKCWSVINLTLDWIWSLNLHAASCIHMQFPTTSSMKRDFHLVYQWMKKFSHFYFMFI